MQIQIYDVIMLMVLAAAAAWGAWKGLAWQVASIASLALSYFVAHQFSGQVAQHINAAPPWNVGAAMLGLFLGTSLAVWLAFRLVSGAIDKAKLKSFDRQIGALVGLVKGALLCVVITIFAVSLLGPANRDQVVNSKSGHYIAVALDRAQGVMPKEVHRALDPYLHKLDDQLSPTDRFFGGMRANENGLDLDIELPDGAQKYLDAFHSAGQGSLPTFTK